MNVVEYFTFLTGLTPTEDQKKLLIDLLDADRKRILIAAGRQVGKTLTCAVVIFWLAFELEEEIKILLVAQGTASDPPIYTKIKEIFRRNREYFINKVIIVNKYEDLPKYGFETRKGSYVHYRNATEGQVRGVTTDFVFIDEAGIVKDDVTLSAFDCKSGKWSKFICLSTPPEKANLFTRWFNKATELGFTVHHWSELGLSWHSEDDLKFKKSEYSWQRYKREVLGQFLSTEEMTYFEIKDITLCTHEHVERENVPNSRIEMGIDWGESVGETVVTITEKIYNRRNYLFVKRWRKVPYEEQLPEIKALQDQFKPYVTRCDSKPSFVVDMAKKQLKNLKIIDFQFHKKEMLAQLSRKIKTHSLAIGKNQVDLIKQLKSYRLGKRAGDDMIDSLCLSIFETSSESTGKTNIIK